MLTAHVMSSYGRSRDTTAPAGTVWRIWSDTSTWPHWNPDVQEVALGTPFGPGATGTMLTKSGGRHDIAIREVDPGRSFVLESTGVPATKLRFRCEVTTRDAGSSVSQSVTLAGPLAFAFGPMMGPRIAASFTPLLDGLAHAAEGNADT